MFKKIATEKINKTAPFYYSRYFHRFNNARAVAPFKRRNVIIPRRASNAGGFSLRKKEKPRLFRARFAIIAKTRLFYRVRLSVPARRVSASLFRSRAFVNAQLTDVLGAFAFFVKLASIPRRNPTDGRNRFFLRRSATPRPKNRRKTSETPFFPQFPRKNSR